MRTWFILLFGLIFLNSCKPKNDITQDELVRRTQELFDSVATGDQAPMEKERIEGDVAILSYDTDEKETIFGQNLTARYHATDTWIRRNGQWQIVASQVLRYYEDPAPGKADIARFAEYVGTYELAPANTLAISTDGKLYTANAAIVRRKR